MELLQIAPLRNLLSHLRFMLTLRSQEGHYHSLILFRLSTKQDMQAIEAQTYSKEESNNDTLDDSNTKQIYIMEASCPHMGADMSHAEIEECDTGVVAVCPWHRYDFDLKTGKSEMGLHTCTYDVSVKVDTTDNVEKVYMETPAKGTRWRLVELRPVSEAFADPPPLVTMEKIVPQTIYGNGEKETVIPSINPPKTLMEWAVLILNTPNPILKVERTRLAVDLFRTGKLSSIGHRSIKTPRPPDIPLREKIYNENTVDPRKLRNRKSLAVMLHALANIEQWAIDLAWDIMARFGSTHPNLPQAFFSDFSKMALDEAKHFSLLTSRLASISPSTPYGSMPVHAGLWESATVTSHSFRARLAIIHLVHEARGLDVNPQTIERFRRAGDTETVKVMEIIHADEVTHVTSGHRWFTWVCEQQGNVNPITAFREEVKKGWRGDVKGPFNVEDREKAGLTPQFYEDLKGEMDMIQETDEVVDAGLEDLKNSLTSVKIEYDMASKS